MTKTTYTVTAFRHNKEFITEKEARAHFEKVKHNFTYCELKEITKNDTHYYSKSLEIFRK